MNMNEKGKSLAESLSPELIAILPGLIEIYRRLAEDDESVERNELFNKLRGIMPPDRTEEEVDRDIENILFQLLFQLFKLDLIKELIGPGKVGTQTINSFRRYGPAFEIKGQYYLHPDAIIALLEANNHKDFKKKLRELGEELGYKKFGANIGQKGFNQLKEALHKMLYAHEKSSSE